VTVCIVIVSLLTALYRIVRIFAIPLLAQPTPVDFDEIKQFLWDIRQLGTAIHQRTRAEVDTPFVCPPEDRDMRWFAALFLLNLDLPSRPTQVDWQLEFNRHQYAPWLLPIRI
jgi:hypothetical protein